MSYMGLSHRPQEAYAKNSGWCPCDPSAPKVPSACLGIWLLQRLLSKQVISIPTNFSPSLPFTSDHLRITCSSHRNLPNRDRRRPLIRSTFPIRYQAISFLVKSAPCQPFARGRRASVRLKPSTGSLSSGDVIARQRRCFPSNSRVDFQAGFNLIQSQFFYLRLFRVRWK